MTCMAGMCLELELLLVVGEGLVGVCQRALLDLLILIRANEIPVDVFDLGVGSDDLGFEREVRELQILFGNAE